MAGQNEWIEIIFLSLPESPQQGANKTRLIPAIGAENATQVYRQLVAQTLSQTRQLVSQRGCRATICFTGGTASEVQAEFGDDLEYSEQRGASLGDRLGHATRSAFDAGAKRVLVIGTDSSLSSKS